MKIVWRPQEGPQAILVECPVSEIFYGGARGGGKTDGVLGKWAIKAEYYGHGFNGIFFRRELPMCDDAIERSQEIFAPLGWSWNGARNTWRSPRGARIRFRPLERVQDADKFQGQNVSDACVEEAGQYPDPAPIDRLNGTLRSVGKIPTQLILTGNPGGAGHTWIRKRYIDPCPGGMRILHRELPNGDKHEWIYIPSRLENNMFLGDEYVRRLYLVGKPELVRAWLEGDWDAIEGAFFDNWSGRNIVAPHRIPEHWIRFRSLDWGSARPFSVGWWAVADGETHDGLPKYPRGALVRYREWYGAKEGDGALPNEGVKMFAEEVAEGIAAREAGEKITYGVADPSIFAVDGGPSIAERMLSRGIAWTRGDNRRVPRAGAMGGWDQMRGRISGGDEGPMLYVFDSCRDFIRTVPVLQHDASNAEDLDTAAEDHVADEARYACMSRPWVRESPAARADMAKSATWDDLFAAQPSRRRERI